MKIIAFALLTAVSLIAMPDNVSVDVGRVLADVSSKPLGINTDFFVDDDANRPAQRNLDQALAEMGVKYLRYPEGRNPMGICGRSPRTIARDRRSPDGPRETGRRIRNGHPTIEILSRAMAARS